MLNNHAEIYSSINHDKIIIILFFFVCNIVFV